MLKRSLLFAALLFAGAAGFAQKTYMAYLGSYNSGTVYAKNELVLLGTTYYISLTPANANHLPTASPLQWAVFGSQAGGVGAAGESAYQIATDNGFTGTVQQWLASLTGTPGAAGTPGINGTNGTNGVNGSTWYRGTTAPVASLGVNGDYYFNTASSDVSQKVSGSWTVISNLLGRGFNFRGAWAASTAYAAYDVVTYGGATYEASSAFLSGTTFTASNWNVWASAASVNGCSTNGLNGIYFANCYVGADVGAQINAADAAIGSKMGTIVVADGLASSTISTAPSIGSNHRLEIAVPLTINVSNWSAGTNSAIVWAGQTAPAVINSTGPLISVTTKNNIEAGGLWATWTTVQGGNNSNVVFRGANVRQVHVHDDHLVGGGYLRITSLTDNYDTTVVGTNDSSDIYSDHNWVDGVTGPCQVTSEYPNCGSGGGIYAAFISYSQRVYDDYTVCNNLSLCRFGWGGNNTPANAAQNPGNWTSFDPSTLKASGFHYDHLSYSNVEAAEVWSMVNKFTSHSSIGVGCGDVCEDTEGAQNGVVEAFDASGALNGELSEFPHTLNVSFGPGVVHHTVTYSTTNTQSLSAFTNNPTNDSSMVTGISYHDIVFDCRLTASFCSISSDPAGISFFHNKLINTQIRNSDGAAESGSFDVKTNTFVVNALPQLAFQAKLTAGSTSIQVVNPSGIRRNQIIRGGNGLNDPTYVRDISFGDDTHPPTITVDNAPTSSSSGFVTMVVDIPVVDLSTYGPGQPVIDGNIMSAASGLAYYDDQPWIYGWFTYNNGFGTPAAIISNNNTSGLGKDLVIVVASMNTGAGTAVYKTFGNSWGGYYGPSNNLSLYANGLSVDFWTQDFAPTAPTGTCPSTAAGRQVASADSHLSVCTGGNWVQKF